MIEQFKAWCYKIIPLVYDDSLSYYEFLCKVQNKLNEVILSTNEISDVTQKTKEDVAKMREELDNFFNENLGEIIQQWIDEHPGAIEIGDGSVTNAKLSSDSVGTANIINGTVTGAKLAQNSVAPDNIQPNAVGTRELADNAVTSAKLADGVVTPSKLDREYLDISRKYWNNVKDYGAVGDGVTDDSDAIQAAINDENFTLTVIPRGVFAVSKKIIIPWHLGKSVEIIGSVKASTVVDILLSVEKTEVSWDNTKNRSIYGGGTIDCNSVANVGLYIQSNCPYVDVNNIQIRNVKQYGLVIGEDDVASSNQDYIRNVGIYGNDTSGSTAARLYGTDNLLDNCHFYNCQVGMEHYADVVSNLHTWNRANILYNGTVGVITHGSLIGGTVYCDSCETAVKLPEANSKFTGNLTYLTDTAVDNASAFSADWNSNICAGIVNISPNRFTHVNPLKIISGFSNNINNVGTGRFSGQLAITIPWTSAIEARNEFNNLAYSGGSLNMYAYFDTISSSNYYRLGYIRGNDGVVNLDLKINNGTEYRVSIRTYSNITQAAAGSVDTLLGTANGAFYVGDGEEIDGQRFLSVYYKPATSISYAYMSVAATAGGLQGFYPVHASGLGEVPHPQTINSILQINT